MKRGWWPILAAATLAIGGLPFFARSQTRRVSPEPAGYVDPGVCAACHAKISESYRRTGMGRSFYRPRPENTVEDYRRNNSYYHRASDAHFSMFERGGRYYQQRYQLGFNGVQTNIDEKETHFIMGSGNHVRTYLHRTAAGALLQLPLAWYAEKGGYWAMNPGYDKPDQPNARRKITYECIFCHNAYPAIPAGHDQFRSEALFAGELPEGIDCQRCHGPGLRHVQAAEAGAAAETVRKAIVNPARLPAQRQMEVCMQCHLETTSLPFTHSILKYDRGPFSYRPGEPLGSFMLFFDHAPARASEDRFEIVNSVYRLQKAACFQKSNGALQCTTCHNPHDGFSRDYERACRACHSAAIRRMVAAGRHTAETGCAACHMPKRRTQDVVHAVMTDHYIRRRPPGGDLLAEIQEPQGPETVYHGEVLPYYPQPFESTSETELYLALAQIKNYNNVDRGIEQFQAAIEKYQPPQAEFYVELADGRLHSGQPSEAMKWYSEALRRKPDLLAALLGLGRAAEASGQRPKALETFLRATEVAPADARSWQELGQIYVKQGRRTEGTAALEKSLQLDWDVPETHYALGALWSQSGGNSDRAMASFREAIRLQPDYPEAHLNLAILLYPANRADEAAYHFERALRYRPGYVLGHYNYGLMLNAQNRPEEARKQFEATVRADSNFAPAHEELGQLAERNGRAEEAFREYSEAVRIDPHLSRSQLGLGAALARQGKSREAEEHLRAAAAGTNATIREAALRLLAELSQRK